MWLTTTLAEALHGRHVFCILAIKTNKQYEFTVQLLVDVTKMSKHARMIRHSKRASARKRKRQAGERRRRDTTSSECVYPPPVVGTVCTRYWYQVRYQLLSYNPLTCQSINAHTYLCMVSSLLNSAYTSLAIIRAHSSNNRKLLYRW